MSWSDFAIGAQRFFFYAVTAGAAGSALVIFLLLFETIPKWKNSRLKIWWIKSAQLLYLIPFAAAIVIGFRINFTFQGIRLLSDFWRVSTLPMGRAYILA